MVNNRNARFENMVASFFLKFAHLKEDTTGVPTTLHYLRDKEKREVDFVVCQDGKPIFAVEVKESRGPFSRHFEYFSSRTEIPHFYQVFLDREDGEQDVPLTDVPLTKVDRPFSQLSINAFCRDILKI